MRSLLIVTLVSTVCLAEGHAVTFSPGLPGFLVPEVGFEYAFTEKDRLGAALSSIALSMNYELTYTRLEGGLELRGTFGYLPEVPEDEDWLIDVFDQSIFITATCGYRHQADNGFIFRIAGGGGYFKSLENYDEMLLPTAQIGIGYGF